MRVLARGLLGAAILVAMFWLAIYWWFVPEHLLLDIPIARPAMWIRIVAGVLAFPGALLSVFLVEQAGTYLPIRGAPGLYRAIRIGARTTDALVLSALAGWLFGIVTFGPVRVGAFFMVLFANMFFRVLQKGIGVSVPRSASRSDAEIEALSAKIAMERDARPPILYLRSFENEARRGTLFGKFGYANFRNPRGFYVAANLNLSESMKRDLLRQGVGSQRSIFDEQMMFASYFKAYGPYIAIGRPGEGMENMDLGAAKYFIMEEDWRDTILGLLPRCGAIVIDAALSASLVWEICQVIGLVRPRRLLLILPRREQEYRTFYDKCHALFPQSLPYNFTESRLLMFADDWSPIPLENDTMLLEDALKPFLIQSKLAAVQIGSAPTAKPFLTVVPPTPPTPLGK